MTEKPTADARPRRHHYVPRFYLRRFTDHKGRIAAHDRSAQRTITTTPEQVAVERDFYRIPATTGLPANFLEGLLSSVEGVAAEAIRSAVATGAVREPDRQVLAAYLGLQRLRTRQTRDSIREMTEWSGPMLAQIDLKERLESGEFESEGERQLAEQAIEQLIDGTLHVGAAEESLVGLSLKPLEQIVEILSSGWNWIIVVLTKPQFITTDHPVAMLGEPEHGSPASNIGLATAREIWFPLDPRHALVLSRDHSLTSPLIDLSNGHVRAINLRLAVESGRWIFFRPGTHPLKGFQIPSTSPKWKAETLGWSERGDGTTGELIRTGVERPHVPNERLLSGRMLRPFTSSV